MVVPGVTLISFLPAKGLKYVRCVNCNKCIFTHLKIFNANYHFLFLTHWLEILLEYLRMTYIDI